MDKAFTLVVTGDTAPAAAALFPPLSLKPLVLLPMSGARVALSVHSVAPLCWISPVVHERSGTMVTCVV